MRERREGFTTLSAIADGLVADWGVSTAQGGATWWPATIRKVLAGQDAVGASPAPTGVALPYFVDAALPAPDPRES